MNKNHIIIAIVAGGLAGILLHNKVNSLPGLSQLHGTVAGL